MPTTELHTTTEKILARLAELDEARDHAIKREDELIEERREIDAALKEGDLDEDEHQEKIARWGEIQRNELPLVRSAKGSLANQMQKQIKLIRNPKLIEDEPEIPRATLFDPLELGKLVREQAAKKADAGGDEDEDEPEPAYKGGGGGIGPDGRPMHENSPPPEAAKRGGRKPKAAPAPWHSIDVGDIDLPERAARALRTAELRTLGDVEMRDLGRLTTINGVTPADEHHIELVLGALREGRPLGAALDAAKADAAPKNGQKPKGAKPKQAG
jgi:hypothetical protein